MMCYFTPLSFDRECRKEYCTPEDSFWCCTGTGIENHAKYGDSIYFRQGETGLYVNLFIASELSWQTKGLILRQETKYPDEGSTRLRFRMPEARRAATSYPAPLVGNVRLQNPDQWRGATASGQAGQLCHCGKAVEQWR